MWKINVSCSHKSLLLSFEIVMTLIQTAGLSIHMCVCLSCCRDTYDVRRHRPIQKQECSLMHSLRLQVA